MPVKTKNFIAFSAVALIGLSGLTSCAKPTGLVKIGDAPDICPDLVCPVGTEIFHASGNKMGTVTEASASLSFPSGTVKPGFTLRLEKSPGVPLKMDTDAAKHYYVKR